MDDDPAYYGPYSFDMGADVNGHPLNGFGRCEMINTTGVCEPSAPEDPPTEES